MQTQNGNSAAVVAAGGLSREQVLSAHASVPDHVVYREFVNETVVLNLETGMYHGLNPSGGKMLDALRKASVVSEAAEPLAAHYNRALPEIEDDLYVLCLGLVERGLVELAFD